MCTLCIIMWNIVYLVYTIQCELTLKSGIIGVAGIMGVGGKFPNEK